MNPRQGSRFGIPGVISVIALVFAMSGGALAAKDHLQGSGPDQAEASKGAKNGAKKIKRGPRGKPGAAGPQGPVGPVGPVGPQGSAVAYAHVNSNATLDSANSSGVTSVARFTGFSTGFYCLYGSFTPKSAVATIDYAQSSGNEYVQDVGLSSVVGGCPASSAPAVAIVLIRKPTDASLQNAGFYIQFQ
ncbi:MAG: hypothetical protein ACOYD4_04380 [Solirubrobacterales bacterium]